MPTNNFKVGEMLNLRRPNSKTWMNFDGSYTAEIYQGVVHFEDENGNLQNINTDLFDEADADTYDLPTGKHSKDMMEHERSKVKNKKKQGKMDRDDFDYQVPSVPFSAQIPKNIKKGYSVGQNGSFIRFIPQGASPAKGYIGKNEGHKIQYQDTWNDTDVILEITDRGVKETIILKTDRTPSSFSFEVTDGTLNDDLTFNGMKLDPAWLIDKEGTKRDVQQTIRREGTQTFIDMVADVTGLVYPIEIDPTVTISSSSQDATIYNDSSLMATNTGANTTMQVAKSPNNAHILLQFNVSSIPVGAVISTGNLNLVSIYSQSGLSLYAYNLTSGWSEGTVTWNSRPAWEASGTYLGNSVPAGATVTWDIKDIIQKWVTGPNYGLVLKDTINSSAQVEFYAKENGGSAIPSLSITYNMPPTAPVVTAPNGGETWNANHTVTWNAATDTSIIVGDSSVLGNGIGMTNSAGTQPGLFQSFVAPTGTKITQVKINMNYDNNATKPQLRVSVYTTDGNGFPVSEIGYSLVTSIASGVLTVPMNVPVVNGTKYAIVVKMVSSTASDISLSSSSMDNIITSGTGGYWTGTAYNNLSRDFYIEIDFSGNLQYQIQLTTDGTTWSDIIALTTAGATSYPFDFTNKPQTSVAKVRIRAYNGAVYGLWDESNGVFTIQHNTAPTAPTNLAPTSVIDRALVQRLSWVHHDPQADPQSKFDLQWRKQGDVPWNIVTQSVVNQYWDASANTFLTGTIEWQVRTYDQAGLSGPYSAIGTFVASNKPANPTITSPTDNSTIAVANPTVTWSSVDQAGYKLEVLDSTGTSVLWSTEKTSTNKADTVLLNLANSTAYIIRLSVKNADGLYSNTVLAHITVSYTPPAKPTTVVTIDNIRGSVALQITNPTPSGSQPQVSSQDIYRQIGSGGWSRIASGILSGGSFIDYTVAYGKQYQYYVRTNGNNGTYADSDIAIGSAIFKSSQLALTSDLSKWLLMKYSPDRGNKKSVERALSKFAGRVNAMAEYGEHDEWSGDISFKVFDQADLDTLDILIESRDTLLYRDNHGRREFVSLADYSVKDNIGGFWEVSLSLDRVYFVEEV